jgi:hypothetical protein
VTPDPERAPWPPAGRLANGAPGRPNIVDGRRTSQPGLDVHRALYDSSLAPVFSQDPPEHRRGRCSRTFPVTFLGLARPPAVLRLLYSRLYISVGERANSRQRWRVDLSASRGVCGSEVGIVTGRER